MAKAIMIQGTMSNAGKSLIAAGLCRIFRQDGFRTAPFKSQNMALNSYITSEGLEMGRAQVVQAQAAGVLPEAAMNPILLKPTNDVGSQMALNSYITSEGLEMGRAQVVQAQAAGVLPEAAMNPILLKPTNDVGSQVIVMGKPMGTMPAREYFQYKKKLIPVIQKAYEKLDQEYDIIVIEGAGSPAEINLKQDDIVNMGMARMAKAPVLLAGDIDRGGVFAQL